MSNVIFVYQMFCLCCLLMFIKLKRHAIKRQRCIEIKMQRVDFANCLDLTGCSQCHRPVTRLHIPWSPHLFWMSLFTGVKRLRVSSGNTSKTKSIHFRDKYDKLRCLCVQGCRNRKEKRQNRLKSSFVLLGGPLYILHCTANNELKTENLSCLLKFVNALMASLPN